MPNRPSAEEMQRQLVEVLGAVFDQLVKMNKELHDLNHYLSLKPFTG